MSDIHLVHLSQDDQTVTLKCRYSGSVEVVVRYVDWEPLDRGFCLADYFDEREMSSLRIRWDGSGVEREGDRVEVKAGVKGRLIVQYSAVGVVGKCAVVKWKYIPGMVKTHIRLGGSHPEKWSRKVQIMWKVGGPRFLIKEVSDFSSEEECADVNVDSQGYMKIQVELDRLFHNELNVLRQRHGNLFSGLAAKLVFSEAARLYATSGDEEALKALEGEYASYWPLAEQLGSDISPLRLLLTPAVEILRLRESTKEKGYFYYSHFDSTFDADIHKQVFGNEKGDLIDCSLNVGYYANKVVWNKEPVTLIEQ